MTTATSLPPRSLTLPVIQVELFDDGTGHIKAEDFLVPVDKARNLKEAREEVRSRLQEIATHQQCPVPVDIHDPEMGLKQLWWPDDPAVPTFPRAQEPQQPAPAPEEPLAKPEPTPEPLPEPIPEPTPVAQPTAPAPHVGQHASPQVDSGIPGHRTLTAPEFNGPDVSVPPPMAAPVEDDDLEGMPTMADLRARRTQPRSAPAERGWQHIASILTGGLWKPAPGAYERELRSYRRGVRSHLKAARTIVFANGKGGAPKTTSAVAYAAVVAEERGGDVLLWDNNPFMGNLAARAGATDPTQPGTVVDLLRDIDSIDSRAKLNNYLRTVEGRHFLVLASSEDPKKDEPITGEEFRKVHRLLRTWFGLIVVDTGNDLNAPNLRAALECADQVVVPISLGQAAIEGGMQVLAKMNAWGMREKARNAVAVMVRANTGPNASSLKLPKGEAEDLFNRAQAQFAPPKGWMREFTVTPADAALAFDRPVEYERMKLQTQDSWLKTAAAIAKGL
jgi:cellulose biosynthesis protein BcsQ